MHTRTTILTLLAAVSMIASANVATAAPTPEQGQARITAATRVVINNPSGNVSVKAVDADTVKVTAVDEDSGSPIAYAVEAPSGSENIVEVHPDSRLSHGSTANIEVEVPRVANLQSIFAGSGDVRVTGMPSEIRIVCSSGNVTALNVGGLNVKASSGDVLIEDVDGNAFVEAGSGNITARGVKGSLTFRSGSGDVRADRVGGLLDASVASGNLTVADANGDIRVEAISGDVRLDRVGGGVEVTSASGGIYMNGVRGDVEAKTASGDAVFTGEISSEHKYRIRSMSGDAVMHICGSPSGFTATMASYSGDMETSFPLSIDGKAGPVSRRVVGRFGDGSVQISLEAFSGSAKLLKCQ